jgi:hypothetical protein
VNKALQVLGVLLAAMALTVLVVVVELWGVLGRSVQPGPPDLRGRRGRKALPARQALRVLTGEVDLPAPAEVTVRQVYLVPEVK